MKQKNAKNKKQPNLEKAIKKVVKKTMDQEIEDKYVVRENSYAVVGTSFNVTGTPLLAQLATLQSAYAGLYNPVTDNYGMLGMEIKVKFVELNYSIKIPVAATPGTGSSVRMLMVWDNEPAVDTSFSSTLVLYNSLSNYDDIILRVPQITSSYFNTAESKKGDKRNDRFTVIYDRIHNLGVDNIPNLTVRKKISLHNKKLRYSMTSATGAVYPLTGTLLLFAVQDPNNSTPAEQPQLEWNSRVWFQDA